MSNTLTEKAVVDRLKTLMQEVKGLQEDIKQLVKDAKDQGLPAARLKKLAKLDVDGKLEEYREEFEAMQDVARMVGSDALELEPELPLGDPEPTIDRIKNIEHVTPSAVQRAAITVTAVSVEDAIKRFSNVPPPSAPPSIIDDSPFDRDEALAIPPSLRRAP